MARPNRHVRGNQVALGDRNRNPILIELSDEVDCEALLRVLDNPAGTLFHDLSSAVAHQLGGLFGRRTQATGNDLTEAISAVPAQSRASLGKPWEWFSAKRAFRRLLSDYASKPEISAKLIALAAERDYPWVWSEFAALAQRNDLTFPVRRDLFRIIWTYPLKVAPYCQMSLLELLGNLANEPGIASAVFEPDNVPPTGLCLPGTMQDHMISILFRPTHAAAEDFLCLLAWNIFQDDTPLDRREHGVVVQRLLHWALAQSSQNRSLWERIVGHLGWVPDQAQSLIADSRVPVEYRVRLISMERSYQQVLRFLSTHAIDGPLRKEAALAIRTHFPDIEEWELGYEVRTNSVEWQQLLATDAFFSEDLSLLVPIVTACETPRLCRRVALSCLKHHTRAASPEARVAIVGDLTDYVSSGNRTADWAKDIYQILASCFDEPLPEDSLLDTVIQLFANNAIDTSHRQELLAAFGTSFVQRYFRQIWDAIDSSGDRALRPSLFAAAFYGGRLYAGTYFRLMEQLESSENTEVSQQAWQDVRSLAVILTDDAIQLTKIAIDLQQPPVVREGALPSLPYKVDAPTWSRLWRLVASKKSDELWDDATIPREIERLLGVRYLAPILQAGPKGKVWDGLIKLAQHPDHELARLAVQFGLSPSDKNWAEICSRLGDDVPPEAILAMYQWMFSCETSEQRAWDQIRQAFAAARPSHSLRAELTDLVIRTAVSSTATSSLYGNRIVEVLTRCAPPTREERAPLDFARKTIQLIRYARIEAMLAARMSGTPEVSSFTGEPELLLPERKGLVPIAEGTSMTQAVQILHDAVSTRIGILLPKLAPEELETILEKTPAPIVLAVHYQRTHPDGLPLLAEATRMAARGESAWNTWRFDRPDARAQLAGLTEDQIACWKQNFRLSVEEQEVPDDIQTAAARIRARFRKALGDEDIPTHLSELLVAARAGRIAPADQIRAYRSLRGVLGRRLDATEATLSEELRATLPASLAGTVDAILAADSPERATILTVQHTLDRAIDLLRLLHCDERALARNELRAKGESGVSPENNAVAYFAKMRHAFRSAQTRDDRLAGKKGYPTLEAALQDAQADLQRVKTFVATSPLQIVECSDFPTLIEIGHRPYGQGSCQDYTGTTSVNRALLAYVVDAMTKALVLRIAPTLDNPHGTPLARAIVRLGTTLDTHEPILVLERTYTTGGENSEYDHMLRHAAREFATQRGWQVAKPYDPESRETGVVRDVVIPASQNGVQYEDGARAMHGSPESLPRGEYILRVRCLDA